ncbi:Uncharacterized protein TCM_021630 [Theobroma cacao]|uniref:Uncharacterized protein n=1 Tax=Theobroma cacao TaxID=3641 RepID=A0A061EPZ9_THECC|nr:Uncharacterized protein TCM_021630 [Theobroma cacao]
MAASPPPLLSMAPDDPQQDDHLLFSRDRHFALHEILTCKNVIRPSKFRHINSPCVRPLDLYGTLGLSLGSWSRRPGPAFCHIRVKIESAMRWQLQNGGDRE